MIFRPASWMLTAAALAIAQPAFADQPPSQPTQEDKPAEKPKTEPPPTTLDFDLLGEGKPALHVDEGALRRRRTMLNVHQGFGLGMFAVALANTVVGQLNYSDRFASGPSTGKYELTHKITAYSTVGLFAVTGLLAVFAPNPIPKSGGFDRVTLHKIAMATATAGMVAQVALGIWTSSREGYLNQPDIATAHLVVGYVTFAAITLGVGAIVF